MGADEDDQVPGLAAGFAAAQLTRFFPTASAWCDEQGAATLEEVNDELDDLASSLIGLKPLERKRLQKVLAERLGLKVDKTVGRNERTNTRKEKNQEEDMRMKEEEDPAGQGRHEEKEREEENRRKQEQ